MRLFELVLIVANIVGVLAVGRARIFSRIMAAAIVVIGGLHLGVEHYRWQMLPAYVVAGIVLLAALLNRDVKRIGRVLFILLTLISLALRSLFPIPELPLTSGAYGVGTMTEVISYDGRDLVVQIWYPAVIDGEPTADYIPNIDAVGKAIASGFNLPGFILNHVNLIDVRAHHAPALPEYAEPFPVLLFSHGFGGTRNQNTFQVEEMASQGYIVAATDHHPVSAAAIFPDGRVIKQDNSVVAWDTPQEQATAQVVAAQWAADLSAIADALERLNGTGDHPLYSYIEPARVGAFGHSTGGGAAYEFCYRDDRCQAVSGLDPWVEPTSDAAVQAGLSRPMMAMFTEGALGDENKARFVELFENHQAAGWWLTVAGTTHYDFTDFPHLSPAMKWIGLAGEHRPLEMTRLINDYTRSFFNHHLQDEAGALLYMESTIFPQVTIRKR